MSFQQRIQTELHKRKTNNLYRNIRIFHSAQQPYRYLTADSKRRILTFCSNDYLGLANHPKLIQAFQQAANHYGVGSGAAHLVSGHTQWHQALEEALAEFTQRESALLFSTGYMANLAVISALLNRHDTVYEDRLNHASLIDATRLSGAKHQRYRHNDVDQLQQQLSKNGQNNLAGGEKLIVSDGVFSMDGDIAPLKALAQLAQHHQAWLMIDDAHGLGVLGKTGAGSVQAAQLNQQTVPILMGTLGKAFGTAGAFIAGSYQLIDYLRQTARPYIYTTGQPAAVAAATLVSLKLAQEEDWRREHLQTLIQQFRSGAAALNLALMDSHTAIQPLLIGASSAAIQASNKLEQQGILVTAIRPPTVAQNTARLRITLTAAHSEQDVDKLLNALATLDREP